MLHHGVYVYVRRDVRRSILGGLLTALCLPSLERLPHPLAYVLAGVLAAAVLPAAAAAAKEPARQISGARAKNSVKRYVQQRSFWENRAHSCSSALDTLFETRRAYNSHTRTLPHMALQGAGRINDDGSKNRTSAGRKESLHNACANNNAHLPTIGEHGTSNRCSCIAMQLLHRLLLLLHRLLLLEPVAKHVPHAARGMRILSVGHVRPLLLP